MRFRCYPIPVDRTCEDSFWSIFLTPRFWVRFIYYLWISLANFLVICWLFSSPTAVLFCLCYSIHIHLNLNFLTLQRSVGNSSYIPPRPISVRIFFSNSIFLFLLSCWLKNLSYTLLPLLLAFRIILLASLFFVNIQTTLYYKTN